PIVLLDLGAADRRQSRCRGNALEQRRLARAVFAHEKGHGARERQPLERPDGRNRERKGLISAAAAADRGQVDWTHGSNIPAAGSVAPHLQRRSSELQPSGVTALRRGRGRYGPCLVRCDKEGKTCLTRIQSSTHAPRARRPTSPSYVPARRPGSRPARAVPTIRCYSPKRKQMTTSFQASRLRGSRPPSLRSH